MKTVGVRISCCLKAWHYSLIVNPIALKNLPPAVCTTTGVVVEVGVLGTLLGVETVVVDGGSIAGVIGGKLIAGTEVV